jgi:soluble P-type ATPase
VINVDIRGRGRLEIAHLALDLCGTLATDGRVPPVVVDRIRTLASLVQVHVLTADTFGTASTLESLNVHMVCLGPGDQIEAKSESVRVLGRPHTVASGNGMNDEAMLRGAALGILVIGGEGAAVRFLLAADLVVISIHDGLDLLRFLERLVASLRTG